MERIEELETPVAIVDLDLLEQNIRKLQEYLNDCGVANRPHIKTHKIPEFAEKQVAAGAVGITCQKLGEAEVMAQAGLKDIFLPYNILGKAKLERLRLLNREVSLSVTADSGVTVKGLSEIDADEPVLTVLVEFDTGLGRCGVQTPGAAAELAEKIHSSPGLNFGGLMTYPNNELTDTFVGEVKNLLQSKGIEVRRVSGGGTQCMWNVHQHSEVTEHRAGMYVYGDRYTTTSGAMTIDECSFKVISTVVSRPTPERGILDAGSKTLSSDVMGLAGHGLILEYPEAVIYSLSEEHGHVDFSACSAQPEIGESVSILPNHCCVTNNLFDEIVGHRQGMVESVFSVAARGKVK